MTVAQLKKRMDGRFTRLERGMNARFAAVDIRLDAMDKRVDAMEGRLADMSRSHDVRFASLERHLVSLGDKLDSITKRLDRKLEHMSLDEFKRQAARRAAHLGKIRTAMRPPAFK